MDYHAVLGKISEGKKFHSREDLGHVVDVELARLNEAVKNQVPTPYTSQAMTFLENIRKFQQDINQPIEEVYLGPFQHIKLAEYGFMFKIETEEKTKTAEDLREYEKRTLNIIREFEKLKSSRSARSQIPQMYESF